jgi:hypothetical protein
VRVLERAQIQLLLDELDLAASGAVDPTTAARGGQLLGATRIVQGQLANQAELLSLQATVANVRDGQIHSPVLEQDSLSRYFDLQKRLVIGLYGSLGVQLTAAERERVERRPTLSLQALLEYGLGLLAEDRQDFITAAQHFRRAAELDPNFREARERAEEAQDLADTHNLPTAELGRMARIELLQPLPRLELVELIIPTVLPRDPVSEVLGTDGVGRDLLLDIIIRIP